MKSPEHIVIIGAQIVNRESPEESNKDDTETKRAEFQGKGRGLIFTHLGREE